MTLRHSIVRVALLINVLLVLLVGLAAYASGNFDDRVVRNTGDSATSIMHHHTCPPDTDFVCPAEVLARRRPMPDPDYARTYERLGATSHFHSQFWEDWFLYSEFFYHAEYDWLTDNETTTSRRHTFIELGGYDGTTGSNSYFYDKKLGWRGLLLEASTPNYALMEQNRLSERVATVHGAVCREPRLLTLWGGQSLTANNQKEANGLFHGAQQSISVCLPMPLYMRMFDNRHTDIDADAHHIIDYFSIDVEGQELEVIESHDWVRWPVFVVTVEVAVQPLLSGTAAYQHAKRCALRERGLCRWPFYDTFKPPVPHDEAEFGAAKHPSRNNEVWVNPALFAL